MRSSLNFTNKLNMISQMKNESTFQILEYDDLKGSYNVENALGLNIMRENGAKLKQVRIILDDSEVKLEPGIFSYMKGDISVKNKMGGVLELGKKFISKKLIGEEEAYEITYSGNGDIFLEPSFNDFALVQLEDDEIILDSRLFYACEAMIEIDMLEQENFSSMFLNDERVSEMRIKGEGIVALKIPVPETEIFKCVLVNDTLKAKGNLAILRTGNIEYSIERLSKYENESEKNKEEKVHVYNGTGEVWLIPTKNAYNSLKLQSKTDDFIRRYIGREK